MPGLASPGAEPAQRRPRRPAGTDVARAAGVSQKTVSRVMNDEPYVTDEVRLRVLRAARELGYRPSNAARALNSGRTYQIGVVSLGTPLHVPASELVVLERAARNIGYSVTIVTTSENHVGGVAGAIDALMEQGVEGIVLSEPIDQGRRHFTVDIPILSLGHFVVGS